MEQGYSAMTIRSVAGACGVVFELILQYTKMHIKPMKKSRRLIMSIKNEPKYKNGLLMAIREQLEHRALWIYLLVDEAK